MLASLFELVFIPGHAFLRIKLDKALKRYKVGDLIYLDLTCSTYRFGEIPLNDKDKGMEFMDIFFLKVYKAKDV